MNESELNTLKTRVAAADKLTSKIKWLQSTLDNIQNNVANEYLCVPLIASKQLTQRTYLQTKKIEQQLQFYNEGENSCGGHLRNVGPPLNGEDTAIIIANIKAHVIAELKTTIEVLQVDYNNL